MATVRRGRQSDSAEFLVLLHALARFEGLEPPSKAGSERLLGDIFKKRKLNLLVATLEGRLVGYALYLRTYSSFLARPTLYVEDIFVLEEFRGRGVGRRLIARCAKEAVRTGCGRMEWTVLGWNKRAIRFYTGLGARRLDEWQHYRMSEREVRRVANIDDS